MATISTPAYLIDQAKRRLIPTVNNIPGMGLLEKRLRATDFEQFVLAEPPPGSSLRPIRGDSGMPVMGHMIETFRSGPDYLLQVYEQHGPLHYHRSPAMTSIVALGPDATQAVFSNRNKDFSQTGWHPIIGPFFDRGLMLLDFDEHMFHRRIMQEAFTRTRLTGYVEHTDRVASQVISREWAENDPRFLFHPAAKKLTLDVASVVFMGHEPGTDRQLVNGVNDAFTAATRAGGAVVRSSVPPFKWWRGLRARKVLDDYFEARVRERRHTAGTDMLTVLCNTCDDAGNTFSDQDIVNHMIFLMMAAHDTSTSTLTTIAYYLAANQDWQERCRGESDRLGDAPLHIGELEKLETLDLVINEAMRLVTPLPFNARRTVRDTDLLGHYVPAGTTVMLWPSVTHRLPELWTDPDEFDPARFAEPRSEHKRHRYAFAPFGGGAHKCIGMVFGLLEVKTVMHRLLRKYRLERPHPGYTAKWDYAGMPIPMDGLPIVLRPLR